MTPAVYRVQDREAGRWRTVERTADRIKAVDLADLWAEEEGGTFRVVTTDDAVVHTAPAEATR